MVVDIDESQSLQCVSMHIKYMALRFMQNTMIEIYSLLGSKPRISCKYPTSHTLP